MTSLDYQIREDNDESLHEAIKSCPLQLDMPTYVQGFTDGYNKANEWHHVKEGELPKDNMIDVLALVKSNNGDLIPYIANYSHYSKEWHPDFDDEEVIEVIYWKEIILPKEILNDRIKEPNEEMSF